jgi:hypothetical protein
MKYSPRLIIFCAVSRYLNDVTYAKVLDQIGEEFPKQDRKFLSILKRHFNFELMKDKPYIWQDIWIYNYLKYEYKDHKFSRSGLLAKYEREIVIPSEKSFKELSLILEGRFR